MTSQRHAITPPLCRLVAYRISPRELDVLDLLASGHSNAGVAKALYISQQTVGDHVKRLLLKTDSRSRAEMIAKVFLLRRADRLNFDQRLPIL